MTRLCTQSVTKPSADFFPVVAASMLGTLEGTACNSSLFCRPSWRQVTACSCKPCVLRRLYSWWFEVTWQLKLASGLPVAVSRELSAPASPAPHVDPRCLQVYDALLHLVTRNFKRAGELLLDSIATFGA